MPRLFRKLSDRVRSFGHGTKSINNSSINKENCLLPENSSKRKRSSIIKTVRNSLRKRRKCSDVGLDNAFIKMSPKPGSLFEDYSTVSDDSCISEGSLKTSNRTFTSPPSAEYRTSLKGQTCLMNLDRTSLNNSRNKKAFTDSPYVKTCLSNLKRIQRCDNLTALSEEILCCKTPVPEPNLGRNEITSDKKTTRREGKHKLIFSKEEEMKSRAVCLKDKESGGREYVDLTKDEEIKNNNKRTTAKSNLKQVTPDKRETKTKFILPVVVQFKPARTSRGRISTEDRYSVWSQNTYKRQQPCSPRGLEQPASCYNLTPKDRSPIMSPVAKIRRVQKNYCSTVTTETESKEEIVCNRLNEINTSDEFMKCNQMSGINGEQVTSNCNAEQRSTCLGNNILGSGTIIPKLEVKSRPNDERKESATCNHGQRTCSNDGADQTEYEPHHEKPTDVDIDDDPSSATNNSKQKECKLQEKPEEPKETMDYKEKYPFLSPKQVEYIFAKGTDEIPLCRSHSACNLMGDCGVQVKQHSVQKRNSLSEVDKFNRYIDFLESRHSPNKTSRDFYVSEVMTSLLSESGTQMKSWMSTPNTRTATLTNSSVNIPNLNVDIETGGIAGKKTFDLYPKDPRKSCYFAPI